MIILIILQFKFEICKPKFTSFNLISVLTAERIDLPTLLKITHPTNDEEWSAMDICDAWAKKRGYFTAKAARSDTYRAANNILRMALDGKICLSLKPPNYFRKKSITVFY